VRDAGNWSARPETRAIPARIGRPSPERRNGAEIILVVRAGANIVEATLPGMPKSKKHLVTRFSVSLPPELMWQLEVMTREKGYDNRSLAMADMIRANLVEHRLQLGDGEIAGSITLVYDHHQHQLQSHLTDVQHDHGEHILATMHCHLDHHNCLEVIAVRGPASVIKKMADGLIGAKGVKHGRLAITSTGRDLPA